MRLGSLGDSLCRFTIGTGCTSRFMRIALIGSAAAVLLIAVVASLLWSFPRAENPVYPWAVKRMILQEATGISIKMDVLCQASQSACDRLVQDFYALNERVRQSMQPKK
jgi:hypothetical protein